MRLAPSLTVVSGAYPVSRVPSAMSAPASAGAALATSTAESCGRTMGLKFSAGAGSACMSARASGPKEREAPPLTVRRRSWPLPWTPPTAPAGVPGRRASSEATATIAATATGRARSAVIKGRSARPSAARSDRVGLAVWPYIQSCAALAAATPRRLSRADADPRVRAERGLPVGRGVPSVDFCNTVSWRGDPATTATPPRRASRYLRDRDG